MALEAGMAQLFDRVPTLAVHHLFEKYRQSPHGRVESATP